MCLTTQLWALVSGHMLTRALGEDPFNFEIDSAVTESGYLMLCGSAGS
jgi:hypothetical protein